MRENLGMRSLGRFCRELLLHGTRRFLVLTLPALILAVVKLIGQYWPNELSQAASSHWWAWALAICVGLLLASYSAWNEQFKRNQEMSGKPDITISFHYRDRHLSDFNSMKEFPRFRLTVKNSGQHVAVNISALPITVPIPERIRQLWKQQDDHFAASHQELSLEPSKEQPTHWEIYFRTIGGLSSQDSNGAVLDYSIKGNGPLQQDIAAVLSEIAEFIDGSVKGSTPLTVVFSNTGNPGRTWHMHYALTYEIPRKELTPRFVGTGEVNLGSNACSYCNRVADSPDG
jgi:hypothetical protein